MTQSHLFALHSHPQVHQWIESLEQLSRTATKPKEEEILYTLNLVEGYFDQLMVKINICRILKKGGYGKPNRSLMLRISPPDQIYNDDIELLQSLVGSSDPSGAYPKSFTLLQSVSSKIIQSLIKTGRCYWENISNPPLEWGEAKPLNIAWDITKSGEQILRLTGANTGEGLPTNPPIYLDLSTHTVGAVYSDMDPSITSHLRKLPRRLSNDEVKAIREVLSKPNYSAIPLPVDLANINVEIGIPTPCLHISITSAKSYQFWHSDSLCIGQVGFDYLGKVFEWPPVTDAPITIETVDGIKRVQRDTRQELRLAQELSVLTGLLPLDKMRHTQPKKGGNLGLFLISEDPYEDELIEIRTTLAQVLHDAGWKVSFAKDFPIPEIIDGADWYSNLSETSDNQWFDVDLGVTIEGESVSLIPIILKMLHHVRHNPYGEPEIVVTADAILIPANGKLISVNPKQFSDALQTVVRLVTGQPSTDSKLRISRISAALLIETQLAEESTRLRWVGPEQLTQLGHRLRNFTSITQASVPPTFLATLRKYQQDGVTWLQFLREYELGGILADDMGLGKTVQTLAHLAIEKTEGRLTHPCLIVAPTSVISNWIDEANRFYPDFSCVLLHGPDRHIHWETVQSCDLAITTYPLLVRDKEELITRQFSYIILDEAHTIKNASAKVTQVAMQLQAQHRLCLTGTPMENHVGELWSLFHFLMPGLLGDKPTFNQLYRKPIERDQDHDAKMKLTAMIRPFVFRRTKAEVEIELPIKTEIDHRIPLATKQQELYESIRLSMHQKVRDAIKKQGFQRSQIVILDALLKLRQVCCDPRLFQKTGTDSSVPSAKLNFLMEILPQLIEEGRRILLFSQFTSMLELIEKELNGSKIPYLKLTGSTKNRPELITQFQAGTIPVFLISLKAGGTGLNLTAADTVIHYDPWWNPAVENQATDRAHRIGQNRPVFVYKLIMKGTVEEKIITLQEKKKALADGVLADDQLNQMITSDDLDGLFR